MMANIIISKRKIITEAEETENLTDNPQENESDEKETEAEEENINEEESESSDDRDAEMDDFQENESGEEETTDDSGMGEDAENQSSEPINNEIQNKKLINDFIELYELIESSVDKLNTVYSPEIIINSILTQVLKNLVKLKTNIYDFLELHFQSNTYSKNLYYYELIVQSVNRNIEMIEKISQSRENK